MTPCTDCSTIEFGRCVVGADCQYWTAANVAAEVERREKARKEKK